MASIGKPVKKNNPINYIGSVYIGPYEIAGYNASLAAGFRRLNIKTTFTTRVNHSFKYFGEDTEVFSDLIKKYMSYLQKKILGKRFSVILFVFVIDCLRVMHFVKMLCRHHVFIFIFGESLLAKNIDLPILRLLGKKVIFNLAMGSEARPPYINGALFNSVEISAGYLQRLRNITKKKKKAIVFIEKHSDYIIGSPYSTSMFLSRPMINHFAIGLPSVRKFNKVCDRKPKLDSNQVTILHAPSNPLVKGSQIIREAIADLKNEGLNIHYEEITNKPNSMVIEAIVNSDFLVDQVYSDTPLAGLATEAAWLGRPVVIAGYGFDTLQQYVSTDMIPPSYRCLPAEIKNAIKTMVLDEDLRVSLGITAYHFVSKKWSAEEIASRYLNIITGNIPNSWWLDPNDIRYFNGGGISEIQAKMNIKQLVKKFGPSSLQLSHNPSLEKAFLEFAEINEN